VAGGGHLYCGRGPEVPESAVPHHRSAGPSVLRGYVPEPCWVMTVGRAGAGCRPRGLRGREAGRAGGQRHRSHPGRPWPGVLLPVALWNLGRTDA